MLNRPIELKPCPKCGILPVKDKRKKMLGSINDGGYTITQGRYRCPNCQLAPSWGKSYCIDVYGWTCVEVMTWNCEVETARALLQPTKYLSNEGGTSAHEGRDHQPGSAPGFVQEPR